MHKDGCAYRIDKQLSNQGLQQHALLLQTFLLESPRKMSQFRFLSSLICVVLLTACSTTDLTKQTSTTEITIFSINDFHGNLQSDKPVPYLASTADPHDTEKHLTTPAGGYAYLAGLLKERRKLVGASILVGGGDLIGASPMGSALLKDEPVIEALNQLDLQVTAVGNHEFDKGTAELQRKIHGQCPPAGCVFPDFHGAKFTYLGANVFEKGDKNPWLPPYAIRDVGGMKIGFIGAVTTDVPNLVAGDAVKKMSFEDEATAINRYVPELQKQGVAAIVLLIHEGATYKGAANDPTYRCKGLQGPIIDIVKKLDKAISLVISAHTHQAYTCKIDGHLVVQGKSYGAYLTESTLTIDTRMHTVVKAEAKNILVDQQKVNADPTAQKLVRQVEQQTNKMRQQFVAMVDAPLKVESE
ncbi:MAG: metallophosphoesterase, partial [Burkholderiales bacterium]|nr:metallophosphoesterase [Burkholderiales bacterium]